MKIGHFGDIHLDEKPGIHGSTILGESGLNIRLEDADRCLTGVVSSMIEHGVELALCAGDVFERPNVTNDEIRIAKREFLRLARHCPVIIVAGNHDVPGTFERADALTCLDGLHANITIHRKAMKTAIKDVDVFAIPYPARQAFLAREENSKLAPQAAFTEINRKLESTLAKVSMMADASAKAGRCPVLLAHMAVVGAKSATGWVAGPSEPVLSKQYFERFHYVALGHIHLHQLVDAKAAYCGGIMVGNHGEEDQRCGWILAETGTDAMTFIDLTHLSRPYYTIDLGRYTGEEITINSDHPDFRGCVVRLRYAIPDLHDLDMAPLHNLERWLKREAGALSVTTDPDFIRSVRARVEIAPEKTVSDLTFTESLDLVLSAPGNEQMAVLKAAMLAEHEAVLGM